MSQAHTFSLYKKLRSRSVINCSELVTRLLGSTTVLVLFFWENEVVGLLNTYCESEYLGKLLITNAWEVLDLMSLNNAQVLLICK